MPAAVATPKFLEYSNVSSTDIDIKTKGKLRFETDKIIFTNTSNKEDKVTTVFEVKDIKNAYFTQTAQGYMLILLTAFSPDDDNSISSDDPHVLASHFRGLSLEDLDSVQTFMRRNYEIEMNEMLRSVKGADAGVFDLEFAYNSMRFMVDQKLGFEIPLDQVNSCDLCSKNETVIKFRPRQQDPCLVEIRFSIPQGGGGDEERMERYRQKLTRLASAEVTESICDVPQMSFMVPRGKYDMKLVKDFVDLHGKSFDYKIMYNQIAMVFILENPLKRHVYFAFKLIFFNRFLNGSFAIYPPVRQGQTLYPFVILQCESDEEIELDVKLPGHPANDDEEKMKGATYEVLAEILKQILPNKFNDQCTYRSAVNTEAAFVNASIRACSGLLYPMDKGILFMHKPTFYLPYEEMLLVDMGSGNEPIQSSSSLKTFMVEIKMKNGTAYSFSSIDREEQKPLASFIKSKRVDVSFIKGDTTTGNVDKLINALGIDEDSADDGDDEEDEDYEAKSAGAESDEIESDHEE
ncbi:hypothetical protein ACOME3_000333 [Neoechinorhynchus agilis]